MARESTKAKIERANEVENRLFKHYGEGKCPLNHTDAFTLTCAVVLSAQCTDAAVNKVTPLLFEHFGTPEKMAAAKLEQVETIIHPLGFYHNKAKSLIALATMVCKDFGGKIPDNMADLMKLPGVGRKTANCVMTVAFKNPQGIAVDTHVYTIAHRLAFASPTDNTPDKTEVALMKLFPQDEWLYLNHQLIQFGRDFCRKRNPLCETCFLGDLCPSKGKVGRG